MQIKHEETSDLFVEVIWRWTCTPIMHWESMFVNKKYICNYQMCFFCLQQLILYLMVSLLTVTDAHIIPEADEIVVLPVQPYHDFLHGSALNQFLWQMIHRVFDNREYMIRNYPARLPSSSSLLDPKSKRHMRDAHACALVCGQCARWLTLQWSSLCWKQCHNEGAAFNACLVIVSSDMRW